MNKPSENNFKVKKIWFQKGGGMKVEYSAYFDKGGIIHHDTITANRTEVRHPDIDELVDHLKEPLLHGAGYLPTIDRMKEVLTGAALTKFKNHRKDVVHALMVNTKIVSISFSGSDEFYGVILSGTLKTTGGQTVSINTPRIIFKADVTGMEGVVSDVCERLETESYLYLYEGKESQATIEID